MQPSAAFLHRGGAGVSSHLSAPHKNSRAALIETVIFLSVMVFLNGMFSDGQRFITMGLHPFWIIVVLVALQYGPREVLGAAVLASLFLLVGNMPEQNLTETMYEYTLRVTSLPVMWIVAALVLGGVRSRQLLEKQHLHERLTISEVAQETIAKAYTSLKKTKEQLERRLAEERRSVLTVYNIAKSLETIDPDDVLIEASKLVEMTFNPRKFSFYRCDGKGLHLEAAHGWEKSDSYASHFGDSTPLARNILEKKRTLSIAAAADELLLDGQGMLAGPIVDSKTGKIFGMLKIEEIAFMDMGIRTHEAFHIVCEWIGRVYDNVERYQSAHKNSAQSLPDHRHTKNKLVAIGNMMPPPSPYAYPAPKIAA